MMPFRFNFDNDNEDISQEVQDIVKSSDVTCAVKHDIVLSVEELDAIPIERIDIQNESYRIVQTGSSTIVQRKGNYTCYLCYLNDE